jgi:hypothetical protein
MRNSLLGAIALFALSCSTAFAACDTATLQAKAQDLGTKLAALSQKNPQKATEVSQKISADANKPPANQDEVCKRYDSYIAMVDAASK